MSMRGAQRARTAEFNDSATLGQTPKFFSRVSARRGKNVRAKFRRAPHGDRYDGKPRIYADYKSTERRHQIGCCISESIINDN
jgi:hypothetical protein